MERTPTRASADSWRKSAERFRLLAELRPDGVADDDCRRIAALCETMAAKEEREAEKGVG